MKGTGLLLQISWRRRISQSFFKWIWLRFARCHRLRCPGRPTAWSQSRVSLSCGHITVPAPRITDPSQAYTNQQESGDPNLLVRQACTGEGNNLHLLSSCSHTRRNPRALWLTGPWASRYEGPCISCIFGAISDYPSSRSFAKQTQTLACLDEVSYMDLQLRYLTELVLRDISERGRDIEGCIKQWFSFVKVRIQPAKDAACSFPISTLEFSNLVNETLADSW